MKETINKIKKKTKLFASYFFNKTFFFFTINILLFGYKYR